MARRRGRHGCMRRSPSALPAVHRPVRSRQSAVSIRAAGSPRSEAAKYSGNTMISARQEQNDCAPSPNLDGDQSMHDGRDGAADDLTQVASPESDCCVHRLGEGCTEQA